MPFFEEIGKKITNISQSAIEKTKCSTETLHLNNQIREEQRLCKTSISKSVSNMPSSTKPTLTPLLNR